MKLENVFNEIIYIPSGALLTQIWIFENNFYVCNKLLSKSKNK